MTDRAPNHWIIGPKSFFKNHWPQIIGSLLVGIDELRMFLMIVKHRGWADSHLVSKLWQTCRGEALNVWNTAEILLFKRISSQQVQNRSHFGKEWRVMRYLIIRLFQNTLILFAFGIKNNLSRFWALRTCEVQKSQGWQFPTRSSHSAWANTWHASRLELM